MKPQGVLFPDTHRSLETATGEYTWQLGLGYTPSGREGFGGDAFGQPYRFTILSHEWRLSLTKTVHFGGGWKTGIEIAQSTIAVDELRRYPWGEAYSAFQEWRIDPKSLWDPRASMSLGHPWEAGVAVAASFLRDPIVLVGEIGLRTQEEGPHAWLILALSLLVGGGWRFLLTVEQARGRRRS